MKSSPQAEKHVRTIPMAAGTTGGGGGGGGGGGRSSPALAGLGQQFVVHFFCGQIGSHFEQINLFLFIVNHYSL